MKPFIIPASYAVSIIIIIIFPRNVESWLLVTVGDLVEELQLDSHPEMTWLERDIINWWLEVIEQMGFYQVEAVLQ
jgi:hypothetical protein